MEETVIHEENPHKSDPRDLVLTPEAQYYLNDGAGWAKFLGIMGFIGCGFILIIALSMGAILGMTARLSPNPAGIPSGLGGVFGFIYALLALLYFFPSLYIYKFGTGAKKGILMRESADITVAISKLKSFLKFWGVLMIIGLAFSVLGFLSMLTALSHLSH
ncbi:DUF5362 family protein [Mucilaginibacter jinjuensis]|uniref:DUF5362 family protein n=1 Tax=Mucilaginibacter jinjuensis TaxID=1176721 RepID=A0ABY7TDH2_9SPHI|nr:DUF5362 family protein [Mucilaginibacter jinjuensis]WCT14110.1 DUF5362 family protein [Mucilaginibacter jinjuensis]